MLSFFLNYKSDVYSWQDRHAKQQTMNTQNINPKSDFKKTYNWFNIETVNLGRHILNTKHNCNSINNITDIPKILPQTYIKNKRHSQ